MKYAKLINQYPQFAPNPIKHAGLWYGNPPGSVYEAEGYKPVYQDAYPTEDPPEGYMWILSWSEDEQNIYGHYIQVPVDPE